MRYPTGGTGTGFCSEHPWLCAAVFVVVLLGTLIAYLHYQKQLK